MDLSDHVNFFRGLRRCAAVGIALKYCELGEFMDLPLRRPRHLIGSFSRIISFGCSYTAGAELLDHLVDPTAEKIKRRQGWWHWGNLRRRDSVLDQQLRYQEGQMAWPAHMAKTMGITVDNRAVGGSSLGHAVVLVEQAWCEGLLDDPKVLVVIGVTSESRVVRWCPPHDQPISWILGHPSTWPDSRWDPPTVLEVMSPAYLWHLHTGYLLRLVQIAGQCRATLRLFDMFGLQQHIHQQQHCLARWREILASGLTCWDRSMESMVNHRERLGGMHPTVAVHQRFGAWAVTQLNSGTTAAVSGK